MRLAVLVGAGLLLATAAAAAEVEAPRVSLSQIDWDAAAASLSDRGDGPPAAAFARLNTLSEKRFPGIAQSSVPALLPFDVEAFGKDVAAGQADAATSDKYFGDFRPSKFFLPGPAGYDATFFYDPEKKDDYRKPIEVEITGAAFVYGLDGPDHQEVFPAPALESSYPGIQRILREAHVRYSFERFGVPYVVSIQCYDRPPSGRYLSCREADPVAVKFLQLLRTAGGAPRPVAEPHVDLARPTAKSDFNYYSPGDLIPDTGWNKMPGRADYHVYARMRFPIAEAPAYVKSQSFMPWGDCYRSGRRGALGKKGASYECRRNGIPLVFDESAAANFTYPWRDNFCEVRHFLVAQCPAGYGHQGEDIRPANCVLYNEGADRCLPYQHTVAAVHDGMIRRNPRQLAAYIVVNTPNDFVRFRYLHMNPRFMDQDGLLSGRRVREGEIIGKVGTWGDYANGTSYHIHFNIQVFTKVGWTWVNPYMTLVLSYERLIGGRGTEIEPGEPAPPIPAKVPVVEHPAPIPLPLPPPPATPITTLVHAQPPVVALHEPPPKIVREEPHRERADKERARKERKHNEEAHKKRSRKEHADKERRHKKRAHSDRRHKRHYVRHARRRTRHSSAED